MAFEYVTTVTSVAAKEENPITEEHNDSAPAPVPPAGSGWRLTHMSAGRDAVYYCWVRGAAVLTVTGNYTAAETDEIVLADATAVSLTVTLPAATYGSRIGVKKIDPSSNTVTLAGQAGDTIDGSAIQVITAQYASFTLASDGSNWFIV